MDYEKKYKDLVEAVRKLQEANPSDEGIQTWVNDNVPLLAESEDEKIMNGIISYLKSLRGRHEMFPYEWIDWLERQKYTSYNQRFKGCKVDLEEEISKYFGDDWKADTPTEVQQDMLDYGKHFYELGLKTKVDNELVEEIYSHIDSIKDTADRMTSGNFMHNKASIKFSANNIVQVLGLIGIKTQKGE